ncbi:GNAT family N-acetyltransferase [Chitinimonas sp.]|uniref:GNAT family N-acetyltransferase n=1 Tax=Chitinimonas sp. TaxID=1934313 RepID=UPI002F9210F9
MFEVGEVALRSYRSEDLAVFRRLAELYAYDFSELTGRAVHADGLFLDETQFASLFPLDDCDTYLIEADGALAGFAMVAKTGMLSGEAGGYDMQQFMVLRAYRRCNVGTRAAVALFERYPGQWEVRQMVENHPAQHFWRRVIGAYTAGRFSEARISHPDGDQVVQRFDSRRS